MIISDGFLGFCSPRYILSRELGIKNLKIDRGIRAIRYKKRERKKEEGNLVKMCWEEKDMIKEEKKRYIVKKEKVL